MLGLMLKGTYQITITAQTSIFFFFTNLRSFNDHVDTVKKN